MASIGEGLTKGQVESALRSIAKFHAFSLTLPKDDISSFALEYPRHIEDHRLHIVERVLNLPTTYFAEHKQALRRFVHANEKMPVDTHKLFGTPPILVHGDFWTNNLFFKRDEEGNVGDELHCILDWQCMHP
ncbi:Juvenile hormone-inducible protein, partial [Aphelenchoides avenae]